MPKSYDQVQKIEASTWCIDDEKLRKDKAQRETIRYPLLKRQMGLDYLDTSNMEVWDVGAGPLKGVSSVLRARKVVRVDPLKDDYAQMYDVSGYDGRQAEALKSDLRTPDLVIVTNAMDHFENPQEFLTDIRDNLKSGAYFAHLHAENNAITHPHEAHQHNINEQMVDEALSDDFEKVWWLNNREHGLTYGWRKQPAFSGLYRKVTGYDK